MMKKEFAFALAAALLLTLAACGGKKEDAPATLPGDNPPMAEDIPDQELSLEEDLLNQERAEANRPDQAAIPDPPEAGDYLSGLRSKYEFTETSVEVSGAQAVYTIHVQQDNRLVDCAGIYTMTLEYDGSAGKWNRVDDGWAEKDFTLDTAAFETYHTWVVYPHEGLSANVYLYFSEVTEDGCHIAWESVDDDITVNGSYSGEGDFTFQTGGLNDNDDYPCWVADGLEIAYENYYSGSNHKTESILSRSGMTASMRPSRIPSATRPAMDSFKGPRTELIFDLPGRNGTDPAAAAKALRSKRKDTTQVVPFLFAGGRCSGMNER